jgi:hypothetical protein
LDSKTDEECGHLDRKIFDVKDKTPGLNCPPMHPFCRCSTKIYIDQDTRDDMKRRARNPKTGKNEIVPANMSYDEWAEANGLKKKVVGTDKPISGVNPNPQNMEEMRKKIDAWVGKAEDAGAMTAETRKKFVDGVMANDDLRRMANKFGEPTNGYRLSGTGRYADGRKKGAGSYYDEADEQIQLVPTSKPARAAERTAAHEHGHWWDRQFKDNGLSFTECDAAYKEFEPNNPYIDGYFGRRASFSDEFLSAVRKDRESLLARWNTEEGFKAQFLSTDAHTAIQDFLGGIDAPTGLFEYIRWGHDNAYYDGYYKNLRASAGRVKQMYSSIGMNVSSAKREFRVYETSCELWANITDTIFNNDIVELQKLQECLPESFAMYKKIVGGV